MIDIYGSTWVGSMDSMASISSTLNPRRLREQVLVDPAINWLVPMQDLIDAIVTVEVVVDRTVDVIVTRLSDEKAESRLALNKLAP